MNLKKIFSDKWNILLLLIIIFAFILRIKYMLVNSAVWWDEADYLSLAKHYALGTPEIAAPWRARAMSMFYSIFFLIGGSKYGEILIRFFEQLLAVGSIYLTYLIGKKFYNKYVGLIASFCFSVYWLHLFWCARISGGVFSTFLGLLAIYLFWRSYVENDKTRYLIFSFCLIAYGIFAYETTVTIGVLLALFLLVVYKFSFLKNKKFWYAVLFSSIIILGFFTYNKLALGSIYPRLTHTMEAEKPQENYIPDWKRPTGEIIKDFFAYWKAFPLYLKWPYFILFLLGLISFLELFLGFDLLLKGKKQELRKDLFIIIWVLVVLLFASSLMAFTGFYFEPRFLLPMMPAVFIIVGKGGMSLFSWIKKYSNAKIAAIIIIGVLILGAYFQIDYGAKLINYKKNSFAMEKPAGLWLKDHTDKEDIIWACSQQVPLLYYSERLVKGFGNNFTYNDEQLKKDKPKYVVLDGYYPICYYQYVEQRKDLMQPVQAFYLDPEGKKPIIIIYEVNQALLEKL